MKQKISRVFILLGVGTTSVVGTLALVPDGEPTRAVIAEVGTNRQIYSKTWIRDDATLTSRFSQVPVHFVQNGLMREIDNNFVSNGLARYKNQRNFFEVTIPDVFTNGQIGDVGGKQVQFIPIGANPVSPVFSDGDFNIMTQKYDRNVATYINAWDGVDVEYRTKYYGLKESIIVKNDTVTSFSFRVNRTGLTPTFRQTGKRTLSFSDGVRNVIEIDDLTAHDALDRNVPIEKSFTAGIFTLSFDPVLTTATGTIRVAYPVTIDPTSRFNPDSTEVTSFDAYIDRGCYIVGGTFLQARTNSDSCTTTNQNDTVTMFANVGGTGHVPSRITLARAWVHFNTASTITAGATINATASTSLGFVAAGTLVNNFNDGEDYYAIMQATTSGANPLSVDIAAGDFTRITGLYSALQLLATSSQLDLANDDSNKGHDLSSMANGEARTFILNATGRSNIAIGGGAFATTTFGICEGHDCTNKSHAVANGGNRIEFSTAEGANPPILDIDWTAAAVASKPTRKIIIISWLQKFINIAYAK